MINSFSVKNKKIAFVFNTAAFFAMHRLPIAIKALELGNEVHLFTGRSTGSSMDAFASEKLRSAGIRHTELPFTSSGRNPLLECFGLLTLIYSLIRYKPNFTYCASPKGVLYGAVASRFSGTRALILAITGMGYAFTDTGVHNFSRAFTKKLYTFLGGFIFRHPNMRAVVENNDDQELLIKFGLFSRDQVVLIPGSGVRLEDFDSCSPLKKEEIVLLPARVLRDKGVVEFVDAARRLKAIKGSWRFVLAGEAGYRNPSSITAEEISTWVREGCVEWIGHIDDMTPIFSKASIVCLPSYREGLPKALLEAGAAGCAVVTTNVTGCRDAIRVGETGDLVPVRDSETLAETLLKLMRDKERRIFYGINGQKLARESFSVSSVIEKTFNTFKELE